MKNNIHINPLNYSDATEGQLWGRSKLVLNPTTKLSLIINLTTETVLSWILSISMDSSDEKIFNELLGMLESHYGLSDVAIKMLDEGEYFLSIRDKVFERIQTLITLESIQKDSRALRKWRKTVPNHLKGIKVSKSLLEIIFSYLNGAIELI